VKLESILVGKQRYTSREAVQRFVASLNPDDDVGDSRPSTATADSQEIAKGLDANGF
jgi:hypothetical protein